MADFNKHIDALIEKEGGYVLTDKVHDRGGRTYAGISERANRDWIGWTWIDKGMSPDDPALQMCARDRYKQRYWDPASVDEFQDDKQAEAVFSEAVLSGPGTANKLVQKVRERIADFRVSRYVMIFLALFALQRMARFSRIVRKDKKKYRVIDENGKTIARVRSQELNYWGWTNRVLRELGYDV